MYKCYRVKVENGMVKGAQELSSFSTTLEEYTKVKLNVLLSKLTFGYDFHKYSDILNHYEGTKLKSYISDKILDLVSCKKMCV